MELNTFLSRIRGENVKMNALSCCFPSFCGADAVEKNILPTIECNGVFGHEL